MRSVTFKYLKTLEPSIYACWDRDLFLKNRSRISGKISYIIDILYEKRNRKIFYES